jgi:hypothetical protein
MDSCGAETEILVVARLRNGHMIQNLRYHVIGRDTFGFGFKREQNSMAEHIMRHRLDIFG